MESAGYLSLNNLKAISFRGKPVSFLRFWEQ